MLLATRVVIRILNRRLAAAMGMWIEHFDMVQRIRNLMLQSVARMTETLLWSAFSTWKDGVEFRGEVCHHLFYIPSSFSLFSSC
jgi:hypothetical protein